jgi:uncharacterized protein
VILTSAPQIRDLLRGVRTIAMIGASANPLRPSFTVFSYLRRQPEYDVTPINPTLEHITGIGAFASLEAYAARHGAPDVVDVFRRPSELISVVNDAIAVGAPAIWFQYGVLNDEAIALADAAGMTLVVDRCMKVEHARAAGSLSTSGLNSGVITSRRRS